MYFRPLTVGEMLQETLKLYAKDWRVYVGIVASVQVPLGVAAALLPIDLPVSDVIGGQYDPRSIVWGLMLFSFIAVANVLLTVSVVYGAVAEAVHERSSALAPSFASTMFFGWRKFVALIWASLLAGLALSALSLLSMTCVGALVALPGMVFLGTKWLFFAQIVVIEDAGPIRSLRYSWRLVDGLFWRTLGVGSLLTAVSIGLVSIPTNMLIIPFFIPGFPTSVAVLLFIAANAILTIVATPIQMIGLTLAYYDIKARNASFVA